MTVHTISNKGWVVIPADLRKKYGLEPGTEVYIVDYGSVLVIVPAMQDPVRQAAGMLRHGKKLTKILREEHSHER